jgi:preprotein translocase subunit SecG
MSEAEEIYGACMSNVRAKAEAIQAHNTLVIIMCVLGSTMITAVLILCCLLRRSKRKKQKKNAVVNNNIDVKGISRIEEEDEITTDVLLEGKKS